MSSLCATLLAVAAIVSAEEPAPEEDFLEFLGSLDNDDQAWAELLATARSSKGENPEAEQKTQPQKVDP